MVIRWRILYVVSTVSLQLESVKTAAATSHLCARASKGGVVATLHMCMKPPFPNPGSVTVIRQVGRGKLVGQVPCRS